MRRRGAVDEALILLAEALLFAGLLLLSARLRLSRPNPYPELVAELLNSTPPDAEVLIVLPEPIRVEEGRVCHAGECYTAPITQAKGQAWWWVKVYKRAYAVAGGSPP